MKRLIPLVIAALFMITAAHAQDNWITFRGDNRISVKFPSQPRELTPGSFISAAPDSSIVYVFTIVDFVKVANVDSVALAPVKATPEFASQLKVGMQQGLPGVTMEDFKIGSWRGFTSYTSTGFDSQMKKYDMFMFIIGNKLYSVSTIVGTGASLEGKDRFVKSIILSN